MATKRAEPLSPLCERGQRSCRRVRCVGAAVALLAFNSLAVELTITNGSFENPVLSDGAGVLSVPGWAQQGTVQIYNTDNSFFFNTSEGSQGSPLDGFNAVGVNSDGKIIYQTAHPVAPNMIYSLTFLAGHRAGIGANGSVGLWAGTNRLAEQFPNPTEGTFLPYSLSYTSPPAGPVLGIPLRIEVKSEAGNNQPWYDKFRLFSDFFFCTPHKATATAQLFNGILVGVTLTDSGCGYSNAPTVTIQGGGGTNATATAILTGDRVSAIQVSNGGCCYTNPPLVVIDSPPRVPTVEVRVSKVMVTQNITLGRRYVLESSIDLNTWNSTGPEFTATSEIVEREFDVNVAGRFYRLRELPSPAP